jgi:hypothetical protein
LEIANATEPTQDGRIYIELVKALGLSVPPTLLASADKVIESGQATSVPVKVCGCRSHGGGAAHTGAGVRKPPKEMLWGGAAARILYPSLLM